MIILDATTKKLQVVLAGAVATTQPSWVVSYVDVTPTTYVSAPNDGATLSATPVDIVAAPAAATQRQVKLITLYNEDTANVVATIRYNNNGTTRTLWKGTLLPGQELVYTDGDGFEVLDTGGALKAPVVTIVPPELGGVVLDATTRKLQIVLAGAIATTNPAYVASYVDVTSSGVTAAESNGATNGVTAVDAVAAPAASTQRIVKLLTLYNEDTASVTATVRYNDNGTTRTLWKGTLLSGQLLVYTSNAGFQVFDTGGALKSPQGGVTSPIESGGLVASSDLPDAAAAVTVTGVAYWVYLGRTTRAIVANFVEFGLTVVGTGAQTAEIGLYSSPSAPSRAGLSLSKLVATATVDSLTVGVGVKRNTADFATSIPAGTHLWAGIRTALATTQPTLSGLTLDMAEGRIQTAAAPGVLTGAGPFTGAIIAHATTWQAPDLRLICT